jgi:hypothetical protein
LAPPFSKVKKNKIDIKGLYLIKHKLNMSENLLEIIKHFELQDYSILISGVSYYFKTDTKNDNDTTNNIIYKGKFKSYNNQFEKRFIFEEVEIYNGSCFQHYTNLLSTNNIDKMYYL